MGTVTQLFDEQVGTPEDITQALSGITAGHWLGKGAQFPRSAKPGAVFYHTRYDADYIRGNNAKWYRVTVRNTAQEGNAP